MDHIDGLDRAIWQRLRDERRGRLGVNLVDGPDPDDDLGDTDDAWTGAGFEVYE